jgi:Flp pilus assembly protein TadG
MRQDRTFGGQRLLSRFGKSRSGNIGIMFGLLAVPLMTAVGVGIDYSRMSDLRSKVAAAADTAALAASRNHALSFAQKKAIAEREYAAALRNMGVTGRIGATVTEVTGGVRIDGTADIELAFGQILGMGRQTVTGYAEAAIGNRDAIEIALVLDNTGSMKNDIAALRTGATEFVNRVFGPSQASLRVSMVPYSASVNVGRNNIPMSAMDTGVQNDTHGMFFRNREIARHAACDWSYLDPPRPPNPNPGPRGNPNPNPNPNPGPPRGPRRESWMQLPELPRLAVLEMFGIGEAQASIGITANTVPPLTGATYTLRPPVVGAPVDLLIPTGFQHNPANREACKLMNPRVVSHFDLFARMANTRWKGCVEARPEPFDVTDDPPAGGNSQFVPYFWPDETDGYGARRVGGNNYIPDGASPRGFSRTDDWHAALNLFKFDGSVSADLVDIAPETRGPNKGCPQELVRLTRDKGRLEAAISAMTFWNGGGTITSEGIAWGWRTLTHKAPFADGAAPNNARKYMVVMSDGKNMVNTDPDYPTESDYTAYGHYSDNRHRSGSYDGFDAYLNQRMALVCQNAKAAGITIMTVLFRESDPTARNLMRDCASKPTYAHTAATGQDLVRIFQGIAGEIMALRLTK